ncbi:MAG TPA: hypothetical protein VF677_03445 [Flavobacterium sp.]|jgi:hypothetical protein
MDLLNFVQTGGVPVKAERLQEMQTAYSIFNQLGNLAGDLTIISGCTVTGTSVSDGFVFINGEMLKFKGAFISANVIIIENQSFKEFENGQLKALHFERYATFGTAATSWSWAGFKRIDPIIQLMQRLNTLEKKTAVFQFGGGMVLWNKPAAEIPPGWQEVVNWRGRLPMGWNPNDSDFSTLGGTGGSKSKSVSVTIPHTGWFFSDQTGGGPSGRLIISSGQNETGEFLESLRKSNGSPVVSSTFNSLDPYRVVIFIEYIG